MEGGSDALRNGGRLGIFLRLGIKRRQGHLTAGLLEQDFHLAFGLLQVLLAIARELYTFFEKLHGVIERQIGALQLLDDLFQSRERVFEIRLL
jgi:hypothetical protein